METAIDGRFDAHLHIIDPAFPLVENQGYLPPAFTVADYLATARPLRVVGGAVVSASFQGFDQSYLAAALARLGLGFVGVCQIPADCKAEEIERLAGGGGELPLPSGWRYEKFSKDAVALHEGRLALACRNGAIQTIETTAA